jgi:hypothetical protein
MKKLWNLISIIAFVNLLAILGVGGWLWTSGRMDKEKLREMLAPPPPPEPAAQTAAEPEPELDLTPTGVKIEAGDRQMRRQALSLRRLQEEKVQLDRVLDDREAKLAAEKESFSAERSAWEASIAESKSAKTDEQFAKAVKLLESVPPKQGKELILELVDSKRKDEAVAYLDAMSAFKRSNLMKAFKGEEEMKVAAELLEAIRQRTPEPRVAAQPGASESPNAAASSAATPSASAANKPAGVSTPAPKPAAPAEGGKPSQPTSGAKPAGPERPVANKGAEIDSPSGGERDGKTGGQADKSGAKPPVKQST